MVAIVHQTPNGIRRGNVNLRRQGNRIDSNKSLRQLAKQTGVSHSFLSQIQSGKRSIPPTLREALALLDDTRVIETGGQWRLSWGVYEDGKWVRKGKTYHGTQEGAISLLRQCLGEADYLDSSTLKAYLEYWLEEYAFPNCTEHTAKGYRRCFNAYLLNKPIGDTPLRELLASDIYDIYLGMMEKGLSDATIRQLHSTLRTALKHAVIWGKIKYNVTDALLPPKSMGRLVRPVTPRLTDAFVTG